MNSESITVFRSRLRDDVPHDYAPLAVELEARAAQFAGFVEFKEFTAADGERLALVTFVSGEAEAAWRDDARHRAAREQGRERYYSDYDVAVCSVERRHRWSAGA